MQLLSNVYVPTHVISLLIATTAVVIASNPAYAQSALPDRLAGYSAHKYTPEEVEAMIPSTPNPWLSLRPGDAVVDWSYWRMRSQMDAKKRALGNAQARVRMLHRPGGGAPFTIISQFGTLPFQDDSVQVDGNFDLPPPMPVTPLPEDEGSIPLATDVGIETGGAVVIHSIIGDGPFGCAGDPACMNSGDLDFYKISNVKKGQLITIELDTQVPFGALDPYIEVYNSNGEFIAGNDDGSADSFDSFLAFEAPADDNYYLSIAGFGTFILADPFDSSTGLGNIFGLPLDEGEYTVTIGLDNFVDHHFAFFLRPGDVIGASLGGSQGGLSLRDRTGIERQGSFQDVSFITPLSSPLPSGLISVGHVVDKWGLYRLRVRGIEGGDFSLQLRAALPTLRDGIKSDVQTIFVDFDGATVDLSESLIIGAPPGIFVTTLSPLSAFLANWGLTSADENAVISAIMRTVKQSLVRDIRRQGKNRDFRIRLLNSRDHLDPWGMPNVSRIIVGGTIDELGIFTIGIAQSIDVGNFDTEETGFVLLDLLSDPDPGNPVSLNNFPISQRSSIIKLIGVGVGEITAHEAGHYLGNWHTDQFNLQPNIMDQGGNLPFSIIGIGDDGIFGTKDDVNVMFGRDEFVPNEGFTGIEDTLNSISFGATRPRRFWWR